MRSLTIPKTKLRPPSRPGPLVARPQLRDRISGEHLLTLIIAPAGSGKTTIALDWLAASKNPVAWLSLDADDNDPIRFMYGVVEALRTTGVKLNVPVGQRGLQPIITKIINQMEEAEPVTLILDDYHVIGDASIHTALAYLLDHMPDSLRLVLVTREEPPLPLARLRARGLLRELNLQDLRFSVEEANTLLNQIMGLKLPAEQIQALEERTQGWAAGLQMAALSLQANDAHTIPDGTERQWITEYLLTEIFSRQEKDIQTFLLNTSIFDKFSLPLCQAIMTRSVSRTLARIQKANLFITAVGPWYQYHPLFRDFLQAQLQEQFPERANELHRQAIDWFEENNLIPEAIQHAFALRDPETAARLIASVAPEYFKRGELVTLRRWLERLPESVLWHHARLCLTQIWLLLDSNLSADAQSYFDRLGTFLEKNLRGEFLAVRALHAAMDHQPDLALKFARRAQRSAEAKDPFIQTYVSFGLGAAQKMGLHFFQAEQNFRDSLAMADADGNSYMAVGSLVNLADVLYLQGRFFDAENVCKLALKRFSDSTPESCDWYWTLSRIAYQRNELESALELVNRAIDLSAGAEQKTLQSRALLQRALIHGALGRKKLAHADLDGSDELARGLSDTVILRAVIRQRVLFAIDTGDLASAKQWWDVLTGYGKQPFPFYYCFARGRLLLAERKFRQADVQFESALEGLKDGDFVLARMEVSIWRAICLNALGRTAEAGRLLRQLVKSSQTERLIRPFFEARTGLLELIDKTGRSGFDWVVDILQGTGHQSQGPALTRREREILQLLSMGLSNQEMAERLVIAEGTLKRHVANLYQKLRVHNRAQALRYFHLQ